MKNRLIGISLVIILLFSLVSCGNMQDKKRLKIGVIDSCISDALKDKYDIRFENNIAQVETKNDVTHGSIILELIYREYTNCEFYYCSIYDEKCVGEIADVVAAINWCVEQDVDMITMSFATMKNDEGIRKSIENAVEKGIVVFASCINLSSQDCYPAMLDGVISVSNGFNSKAKINIKGKQVKCTVNGVRIQKREISYLTAYVCGKIAKQLSKGNTIDEVIHKGIH